MGQCLRKLPPGWFSRHASYPSKALDLNLTRLPADCPFA